MLLAAIFEVGRSAHQLDCLRPVSLTMCKPRLCGEDLYADLAGPVRLARLLERRLELLQFADVGLRSGRVAAARSAQRAREVDDGLGRWRIDRGRNLQACRAAPILSLQHVPRGHCGQSSLAAKDGPEHFVDRANL